MQLHLPTPTRTLHVPWHVNVRPRSLLPLVLFSVLAKDDCHSADRGVLALELAHDARAGRAAPVGQLRGAGRLRGGGEGVRDGGGLGPRERLGVVLAAEARQGHDVLHERVTGQPERRRDLWRAGGRAEAKSIEI